MKKSSTLFFGLLFLLLSGQASAMFPEGTYYNDGCSDCQYSNDQFSCNCVENGYPTMVILNNVSQCDGRPIRYENGNLTCAPRLPRGTYMSQGQCHSCEVSGNTLSCICPGYDGYKNDGWKEANLYDPAKCLDGVHYFHGALECIPRGGRQYSSSGDGY